MSFDESINIRVSPKAKALIDKFDGKHTLKDVVMELNNKEYTVQENDLIDYIENVLIKNCLIDGYEIDIGKPKNKNRLWIHIPIIESKRFNLLYKFMSFAFNKYVAAILIIFVLSIFLSIIFKACTNGGIKLDIYNLNSGLILIYIYISLLIHEFGHVAAAYRYGVTAGKLGIGIYLIYPVFYIDLTNAWRIDSKKRMIVDLAGIYFQILTCIPLYLMYYFLNNEIYLITTMLIISTTFINLIHVLKLDGYWFLSDCLRLSNISVEPFKSIKRLILKAIDKNEMKEKCTNSEKVKGIYSLVYVISTILVITYGVILGFGFLTDYSTIVDEFHCFISSIRDGKISSAFNIFNKLFVVILPILFIIYAILKVIFMSLIKLIIKRRR